MNNLFGIGILVQVRDELTRKINQMTQAVENLEREAERLTQKINVLEAELSNLRTERTRQDLGGLGDSFDRSGRHANKFQREMERLSYILGGEVPESTKQAYQEMFRLQQEVRRSSRAYGKYSARTMEARNRLNEFALGLDDMTFKQVFMRSQLGLTEMQLQQQANSMKLNARMTHLMGSQTEILRQRMQGLQRHGVKPEMLIPHSTPGAFEILNTAVESSSSKLYALSKVQRTLGNSMEKVIKKFSAQKEAVRQANGSMEKYQLMMRQATTGMMNLGMVAPFVGAGLLLVYGGLGKLAFSTNSDLQKLADTVKGKVLNAMKPLLDIVSKVMEGFLKFVGVIADAISKFNEAHPAIAKMVSAFLLLLPAMTALMLPVGFLPFGLKSIMVAINGLWTIIGPFVSAIVTASATAMALTAIIVGLAGGLMYAWKHCDGFRKAVEKIGTTVKNTAVKAFNTLKTAVMSVVDAFKAGGLAGAINQIEHLFQNLVSKIASSAPKMIESGVKIVTELAKGLAQALPRLYMHSTGMVKKICEGIIASLPEIMNAGLQILQAYLNALTTNIPMILNCGIQIIQALVQGITASLPKIASTVTLILTTLLQTIATSLPILLNCGIEIIQMLITGITNALPMIIDTAIQIINQLISFITQNLPLLIDCGIQILTSLVNAIVQNLPILLDACIQLVMAIVNGIVQNLPMLLDCAVQLVSALLGAILQNAPQLQQGGVNLVLAVVNGIVSNLPAIISAGLNLIGQLLQCIISNAPRLISAGLQLTAKLAIGILQAVGQAVSAMGNVVSQAIRKIPSFFGQMASMGMQLIKGLAKGIASGASAVVSAIGNVVKGAISAGKKLLGIHSPSRVFRNEIGKYIPQGMAIGIKADTPEVEDAIMDMTTKPVQTAQEYIRSNSSNIGVPKAENKTTNNNNTSKGTVTNQNTYQFNIVLDKDTKDPKDHARQLYEEFKRLKALDESMKYDFDPQTVF